MLQEGDFEKNCAKWLKTEILTLEDHVAALDLALKSMIY